jgi:hypothetical protein
MESATGHDAAQRASLDLLVDTHLHALRDCDVETAMGCVAESVEYELVGNATSSIRGKDAVRAHHVQEFANTIHERNVPLRRLYGQDFVVDELIWEGRITGRMGPLIGHGRRVSQRILRIFEVSEGFVVRQSIYRDFSSIAQQLA